MEDLIFCLNATVPVFLLMIMGYIFRKTGLFNDNFVKIMNKFVFNVALPVLVFQDLASQDFSACWDDVARREEAERLVRRMQFLDKLAHEVRDLEERLDD